MPTHEYVPLATTSGAAVGEDEGFVPDYAHSRSRGSCITKLRQTSFRRNLIVALVVLAILFGVPILQYSRQESTPSNEDFPEPIGKGEYYQRGDVWKHNDEIAARLERCESLGLLRDTADVLPALSDEEEEYRISQGCGTNATTIIIFSTIFHAEAFSADSTNHAGETIYAQSILNTLEAYNYGYMFSSLGWWNRDLSKTVELYQKHRKNVRMVMMEPEQADMCWHDEDQRCLKNEEFMEGIPAWRIMGFWYWDDPGNPLGPAFTLSPSPKNPNTFLSYSIEPTCKLLPKLPTAQRIPPQAWLLAKQVHYLEPTPEFSWTLDFLADLQDELGIKVVGGMVDDDSEVFSAVEESGIMNLGKLGPEEFYEQLAKSFVLIGVGRPRISPSPWDALCMGVPYINPILKWDEDDPDDRSKWHAQQWRMTDQEPPYVYSVKAHDLQGLRHAIKTAMENPIESWVPEFMRWEYVLHRMGEVLEMDWRGKALDILAERESTGEELFLM